MKSIILSAGLGSRAKPLTNAVPKVMLKIGGKPLLEHQIILCRKYGIKKIAVNLHYKPKIITDYFQNGNKWGVKITYSYEKKLLGTAGALKKLINYWNNHDQKNFALFNRL
jgi:NDP-sugar pyrophosphorylase family protein